MRLWRRLLWTAKRGEKMSDEVDEWEEWEPIEPAPEDEAEALFEFDLYTRKKGHNTRK